MPSYTTDALLIERFTSILSVAAELVSQQFFVHVTYTETHLKRSESVMCSKQGKFAFDLIYWCSSEINFKL